MKFIRPQKPMHPSDIRFINADKIVCIRVAESHIWEEWYVDADLDQGSYTVGAYPTQNKAEIMAEYVADFVLNGEDGRILAVPENDTEYERVPKKKVWVGE